MVRRFTALICSLLAGGAVFVCSMLPAAAASSDGGNGLRVSPVTTNLTIKPGQSQIVPVTVQNVTKGSVTLQVIVNDFVAASNETGQPALLLNGQYAPSHSLKRFIAPMGNIILASGEQKTVRVSITIPDNAAGGGYYGAVRFAPASTGGDSNVTLSASVGSLILVKVPGDFQENLGLIGLDASQGASGNPQFIFTGNHDIVAAVRFENKGDIQEQPFGKILLKRGNTQIASYEINDSTPRGNVLPDSIRKFTVPLDKVGAFGKYTLVGNFGYGDSGQLLSGQTTFYVIPLYVLLAALVVVGLILFMIFVFPKLLHSYNERVVRRATRR